jgi:hypothetical protein
MAFAGELGRNSKIRSSADSGVVGHLLGRGEGGWEGLKKPAFFRSRRAGEGLELDAVGGSLVWDVLAVRAGSCSEPSEALCTIDRLPRARKHGNRT